MVIKQIVRQEVERKAVASRFLLVLGPLFFLSGISGLIYQVLWLRQLALVFGVTIYAASTVLASFMAGLALGSYVAGRLVDRARNPLLWYGVAEVLVGLSALATPAALNLVERLYAGLYPSLSHTLALLTLVRFIFSSAVLIVPVTLMGATLPIVVKSSLLRAEGLGERVSFLYATNTAGAIVGTLLAGFYMIGSLGMTQSFKIAAALNVLVGVAAVVASFALKRRRAEVKEDSGFEKEMTDAEDSAANLIIPERTRRLVLFVFALSGLISLALEVVWFRILTLFLEVTTYAFTIMLATFLFGIAAGSYLVTPLMRRRLDWLKLLAVIELAIAVTSVFSLAALGYAYDVARAVGSMPSPQAAGDLLLMLAASFLAIFPSTLLMGIAFPIGLRLWAADGADDSMRTGEQVGLFYSLNLFGAILGSVVAGFLLLPWLGSRSSLIIIAAMSLVSGLLLLAALGRARRTFKVSAAAASALLFLAAALTMPDPFAMVLAYRYPGQQLLWREEGVQTTASVHQQPNGVRVLYLNGLHQASDSPSMVDTHLEIGHLPMILHPNPKEALVIGLGGGVTAAAVSKHPGVQVDVVELSKTVANSAAWFSHVNNDVLRQPNVHLRIDDGRNYMMFTPKRYDVITADLIRPFHAGAGNLYSAEYFRLALGALDDDGIMLQWNNIKSERQYKLIMRTFLSVFPHVTLWARGKLMIGTKRPLQLDPADFERKLEDPILREIFKSMNIESFQSLQSLYVAGQEELTEFVGSGPVLTDDRPMVEYFLSLRGKDRRFRLKNFRGDRMPDTEQ